MKTNTEKIDEILSRGIIKEILPTEEAFRERLLSGEPMKMFIGADPTSSALHLSHAKNFMLLEEFRKLGHRVVVLFGDFTAKIGDPTGETTARKQLTSEEVKANVEGWINQIKPLMDFDAEENPPEIVFNGDWLSKMTMEDFIRLASNFTVQQMQERDMFKKRMKEDKPIGLHEFMYPLMQGFDSVALDVDIELCGTDQIFNALVGRTLLKRKSNKEKFVVAVNLMENPLTKELMSKSKGNGVFLDTTPFDMFGGIMAQPDEMIKLFLVNNTRLPLEEIERLMKLENPMDAKKIVAFEITKIFHGEGRATQAKDRFAEQIQKKETPKDIPLVSVGTDSLGLLEAVCRCVPDESKSHVRRLFTQGAIKVDGESVKDFEEKITILAEGSVVRIGKHKIFRLVT